MAQNGDYLKQIVLLVTAVVLIFGGLMGILFGAVGYYYAQAVVEVDFYDDAHKYTCLTNCGTASATYNKSAPLDSYTAYLATVDQSNTNASKLIAGTGIAFALVGLYMLFVALKGFRESSRAGKKDMY